MSIVAERPKTQTPETPMSIFMPDNAFAPTGALFLRNFVGKLLRMSHMHPSAASPLTAVPWDKHGTGGVITLDRQHRLRFGGVEPADDEPFAVRYKLEGGTVMLTRRVEDEPRVDADDPSRAFTLAGCVGAICVCQTDRSGPVYASAPLGEAIANLQLANTAARAMMQYGYGATTTAR